MDTSPIPGFITRKQAADRCERAERTLQRYWSKAIELADQTVLSHLKLRAEDGEVIEGPAVTKERIDELRAEGRNPTWYAEEEWAVATYGPRGDVPVDDDSAEDTDHAPAEEGSAGARDVLIEALKGEVAELKRDKESLRAELSVKNEQIMEANARTRESNVLMQELQKMLGSWQDQAFKTLPARTRTGEAEPEEGSRADAPTRVPKIRKQPPAKKRAAAHKPKWYEMPTFKRILSRSS